jgi:small subunit ribosomal protein S1
MSDKEFSEKDQAGEKNENQDGKEESFADLFESYMGEMKDDLRVGEQITGEIIAIGDENVFVNTGTKIDGVASKSELMDKDGSFGHKVGDVLTLYVVSKDDSEIRLSRAMTAESGIDQLYEAFRSKIPVQGKVTETCKGGFRVSMAGKTAFCPVSQMDAVYVETPENYVGSDFEFLITRIEERGRNIVVSRREFLERQMAEQRQEFLKNNFPGDVVEGRITRIMPYGAFVELIPGVEGMVHISEISWSRLEKPEDAVSSGDPVRVKILEIKESEKPGQQGRISLSIKQAAGDPWQEITEKFSIGDKTQGIVTRCADFGAFVEISPGVEGLVHISEITYRKRVLRAEDEVSPGQHVAVMIKSIDPENRRISLSMKDAEGDPWIDIENRYKPGDKIVGTVEKKESFGYFVAIEPGIVGLLPVSKINAAPNAREIESCKTDDPISVIIESINLSDRKISLAPADSADKEDWKTYKKTSTSGGSMGDLGEKLRQAMKNKK